MNAYWYSIVRYVPDPVRDERVNIGVVVASDDPDYLAVRFLNRRDVGRLRRISLATDFGFVWSFLDELTRSADASGRLSLPGAPDTWTLERLGLAAKEWANAVQLSEPRRAMHDDPEGLLQSIYDRYVADPRPRRTRARDKRWVRSRVRKTLRTAILTQAPLVDIGELVRRDEVVRGEFEEHKFDYALAGKRIHRFVKALSLEAGDREYLKREVDATAWAIDDVRRSGTKTPIDVVTIGNGVLLASASRIYQGLDANVVREEEIEPWAEEVSAKIVASIER